MRWLSAFSHQVLKVSRLFHDILRQPCAVLNHTHGKNFFLHIRVKFPLLQLVTTTSCPCTFGKHPSLFSYKPPLQSKGKQLDSSFCLLFSRLTKPRPLRVLLLMACSPAIAVVLHRLSSAYWCPSCMGKPKAGHSIPPPSSQMPGRRE